MSNQARADSAYYRPDIDGLRAVAVLLAAATPLSMACRFTLPMITGTSTW